MTGVVLAGGRSRRMGRDKAWLAVEGRPLVFRQSETLARVFDDVVISAKRAAPFSGSGIRVIEDGVPDWAPIHGLRAALREIRRPLFVLAVDLPNFPGPLAAALATELIDRKLTCAAPLLGGMVQGLSAAYSDAVLSVVDAQIEAGSLAIRDLVAKCGGTLLDESFWGRYAGPEAFSNWNRPEDDESRSDD